MYPTMKGLLATFVLLLGALVATGMLASGLQEKATASHRVDEDFLPGGEAIDRGGWRVEPKAVRSDADQPDTAAGRRAAASIPTGLTATDSRRYAVGSPSSRRSRSHS